MTEIEPLGHDWEDDSHNRCRSLLAHSPVQKLDANCFKMLMRQRMSSEESNRQDITLAESTVLQKTLPVLQAVRKTGKCQTCGYTEYEDTDMNPERSRVGRGLHDRQGTCPARPKALNQSIAHAVTQQKDSTVIPVHRITPTAKWEVVTPSTCTENGVKKHAMYPLRFRTDRNYSSRRTNGRIPVLLMLHRHALSKARILCIAEIAMK